MFSETSRSDLQLLIDRQARQISELDFEKRQALSSAEMVYAQAEKEQSRAKKAVDQAARTQMEREGDQLTDVALRFKRSLCATCSAGDQVN